MTPRIPESEVVPTPPEEIRLQLVALRDEWLDMPDVPRMTQEETQQPDIRATKRHNKRRLGAWFGPLVFWVEQAAEHCPDHVQQMAMKNKLNALHKRVTTLSATPYQVTDRDVAEGDALISEALSILGQAEERADAS